MLKIDKDELEILSAYEKGRLKSVATKAELAKLKAAARASAIKDRRVSIRLPSGDLSEQPETNAKRTRSHSTKRRITQVS